MDAIVEQRGKPSPTRVETIPYDPQEENLMYAALTSEPFQRRVNSGLRRVAKLQAESGFTILASEDKILYSPLILGTDIPENQSLAVLQGHPGRAEVESGYRLPDKTFYEILTKSNYLVIGSFHFHPIFSPFSDKDIQVYEEEQLRGEGIKFAPYSLMGLFSPQEEWVRDDNKWSIPSVQLFMFSGPPTNFDYQAYNFNRLKDLKKQKEVLEASGFKTHVIHLNVGPTGVVDLTPLRTALGKEKFLV